MAKNRDAWSKHFAKKTNTPTSPSDRRIIIAGGYTARKKGWRTIDGRKNFYRSLYEINYAHYLTWLKSKNEIKDWEHEPRNFKFPKDTYKTRPFQYLPDFLVHHNDGTRQWIEVKGVWKPIDQKKRSRFHKHFPEEGTLKVVDSKWFSAANRQVKFLVPNWESLDSPPPAGSEAPSDVKGSKS